MVVLKYKARGQRNKRRPDLHNQGFSSYEVFFCRCYQGDLRVNFDGNQVKLKEYGELVVFFFYFNSMTDPIN